MVLVNGLSGELLPVHFKPKDDELLSSWVVRLAFAHGRKPYSFSSILWPGRNFWEADIKPVA
jgi:hypothetical protein